MRILVVGAGIAGLAMAQALRPHATRLDIVERRAERASQGYGLYLPGNATRSLARLGHADFIQDNAITIKRQKILNFRGDVLNDIETARVWANVGHCVALPRATLHQQLRAAVVPTSIRQGVDIVRLEENVHCVSVTTSDGREQVYDLVIGADGIRSFVREAVFGRRGVRPVGNRAWRFLLPGQLSADEWQVALGDGCSALVLPVSSDQVYLYLDYRMSDRVFDLHPVLTIARLFDGICDPFASFISMARRGRIPDASPLEEVILPYWTTNRVVLIGDAAHASSPSMAQGVGMALEDAIVLGDLLQSGGRLSAILAEFAKRRQRRTEWVRKQSNARDRLRRFPGLIREGVLRSLGDTLYRRSYAPLFSQP
jgi:2-heptyl-3-hydroxy-4(1H)-quinolone synthase